MTAIYQREMRSYLTSAVGYVFLAVFYAIAGYYFFATSLVSNSTDLSYVFSNLFSIVIFLVPMLTMRLFSEERRQKTEQALFTAPVSFTGVVMGKFLACLTMYLLGMGVTLLYFLVMCAFQIPDVAVFCGGYKSEPKKLIMGGPMMGNIVSGQSVITKTSNALLVLPKDHIIIKKKNSKASIDLKRAAAACCQCNMCTDLCPRHALGHPIEPHRFMRAATCKTVQDTDAFVDTYFCCSCGLCEMYSCMQSLSPRTLMAEYKAGLRAHGVPVPKVTAAPVEPSRELRKVPMARLMARLGLTQYNVDAPMNEEVPAFKHVKIMLRQHIGAPAVPVVKVGDSVSKGQMIAEPAKGLSVAIHASISGKVTEANDSFIVIDAN